MSTTTNPPHLFRLPLELRQQIYAYLLPSAVKISQPRPSYERLNHPWALSYVSRQTRQEALQQLYSMATFYIDLSDKYHA
ncbi:MAG: hypothetical protein Q9218_004791 [Villophora microphyllina]